MCQNSWRTPFFAGREAQAFAGCKHSRTPRDFSERKRFHPSASYLFWAYFRISKIWLWGVENLSSIVFVKCGVIEVGKSAKSVCQGMAQHNCLKPLWPHRTCSGLCLSGLKCKAAHAFFAPCSKGDLRALCLKCVFHFWLHWVLYLKVNLTVDLIWRIQLKCFDGSCFYECIESSWYLISLSSISFLLWPVQSFESWFSSSYQNLFFLNFAGVGCSHAF